MKIGFREEGKVIEYGVFVFQIIITKKEGVVKMAYEV